jgi:muramidase (phage lysozyme)
MDRAAQLAALALAAGAGLWLYSRRVVSKNVAAFLALLRHVEARDRYDLIAGGDVFTDYSDHPFILNPDRQRPLGTTAAGGYQMVRKTWRLARDFGAPLQDFSPASQDAAAIRLLKFKVPGVDRMIPEGTGNYDLIAAGRFDEAMAALRPEWQALDKMARGVYPVTLAQAREFLAAQGAQLAAAAGGVRV